MRRFLLRRLAFLPASLLLLSLLCFALISLTPGDPVETLLPAGEVRSSTTNPGAYDRLYRQTARRLGLDLPLFYFGVGNAALPDTLHRIVNRAERETMRSLALQVGSWPAVQRYRDALRLVILAPAGETSDERRAAARRVLLRHDLDFVGRTLAEAFPVDHPLRRALAELPTAATRARALLPRFYWHGTANQYHRWLVAALSGDFGRSYLDGRPVAAKLWPALRWTLIVNGSTLLLIYLLAVPLGLYMAGSAGGWLDRLLTTLLFILFGIPMFWVAILATNYLTTPAVGLDLFPSMGVGEVPAGASWWTALRIRAYHLVLPVLCLVGPSLAYLSRHVRQPALAELGKPYVLTARLKGLSQHRILWGHVLRNASYPAITLLGSMIPTLLAGSILIERIFNLPGAGQLLYTAALGRDWPVIIAVVLLDGVLTVLGFLLADVLYFLIDPRTRPAASAPSVVPLGTE